MIRSAATPSERRVFWQAHLAEWRASEQSQAAYCREHGLSAVQFRWWKRTLAADAESPAAAPKATTPAFVPVQLMPEAPMPLAPTRSASGVTLHWGEVRIELAPGFDRASLRAVLHTLER